MTMEVNFTHAYAHSFISVSSGFRIQNFTCSIPSCATLIEFLIYYKYWNVLCIICTVRWKNI